MLRSRCLALFNIIALFLQVKMESDLCNNSIAITALTKNTPIVTKLNCTGTSTVLECSQGGTIHTVYAHYGRLSMSVCNPHKVTKGWQTECSIPMLMELVSNRCNGLPRCEIKLSQWFNLDPCPRTDKYLEIKFKCKTGNDTHIVINPVSTETLFVNCSMKFMTSGDWKTLNSIKLYHSKNKKDYMLVAHLNNITQPKKDNEIYDSGLGHRLIADIISQSNVSVEIANPGFDNEGVYKCVVKGKLKSGRCKICSVYGHVSIDENYEEKCLASISIVTPSRKSNSTNSIIDPGSTEKLVVNCSVNVFESTKWKSVSSLKLYHIMNKNKYELVAYINNVSGHVIVTTGQHGVGSGVFSNTTKSYLSVQWSKPYYDKAGAYRCEVEGTLKSNTNHSCSAYEEVATTRIKKEKCSTWILIEALPQNSNSKAIYLVPGSTKTLVVTCNINVRDTPEPDTLKSLTLARIEDNVNSTEIGLTVLAEIDKMYTPPNIPESNFTKHNLVEHFFSPLRNSYITLTWNNPGPEVAGRYQCISNLMTDKEISTSCFVKADILTVQSCQSAFKITTLVKEGNEDEFKEGFQIKEYITKQFVVNCTLDFPRTQELDSLNTINILRTDDDGVTLIVASIHVNSSHIHIADDENALGKGIISNTSESFLAVLWENQDIKMARTYTCEASGTSIAEKPQKCLVSANISEVKNCVAAFNITTTLIDENPSLNSTAGHINPGSTEFLQVICVLNVLKTDDLDKLISLTLLHSKINSSTHTKLASISTTSGPFQINDSGEGVGYGFISNLFESHLRVVWEYPGSSLAGTYTCEASGMSLSGKLQQCSVSAEVSLTPNQVEVVKENENCSTSLVIDAMDLKAKSSTPFSLSTHIEPGHTRKLRINCSMNVEMADVIYKTKSISLLLAKTALSDYEEVASINHVHGVSVNDEDVSGKGVISWNGISYLYLEWAYPYDDMAGIYKCEAQGRTTFSELETCSSTKTVSSNEISLESLHQLQRINLLEIDQSLEKIPMQDQQPVQAIIEKLDHSAALDLELEVNFEEEFKKTFFFLSKPYKGHRYFLSKNVETFIDEESDETCKRFGGYLAEIDDHEEQYFVTTILQNYTKHSILISGSDKVSDGKYVYERNGPRDVKFALDFLPGEPNGGKYENCLYINFDHNKWVMQDNFCTFYCDKCHKCNFLCEIQSD